MPWRLRRSPEALVSVARSDTRSDKDQDQVASCDLTVEPVRAPGPEGGVPAMSKEYVRLRLSRSWRAAG